MYFFRTLHSSIVLYGCIIYQINRGAVSSLLRSRELNRFESERTGRIA